MGPVQVCGLSAPRRGLRPHPVGVAQGDGAFRARLPRVMCSSIGTETESPAHLPHNPRAQGNGQVSPRPVREASGDVVTSPARVDGASSDDESDEVRRGPEATCAVGQYSNQPHAKDGLMWGGDVHIGRCHAAADERTVTRAVPGVRADEDCRGVHSGAGSRVATPSLFVLMFTAWMAWRWPTSLARGYDM